MNETYLPVQEAINVDQPIRVLHILGSVQRGGTESVVLNNYRIIDKSKVQFDIVIDDNSPYEIPKDIVDLGCKIYKIPPYTKPFHCMVAIKNICKKEKYIIVHSHMNAMSVFPLFATWLVNVPIRIAHSHSTAGGGKDFKRDVLKYILRPFSKVFATHYFACSDYAADWLFGKKTVEKGQVVILNNAISTERFVYNQSIRDELRKSLGLDGQFVVGHIGRFSPQKNHFFLIEIFNALTKIRDDARLLLIGGEGSSAGGIEGDLHKRIDELGLKDKVIFYGSADDISELYQVMDVFMLPSLYEGLGMACIEAQCSGLPCILSDRVPTASQINENVEFLSLKKSPKKWAQVIAESSGKRADYSKEISDAGYDINEVAKGLEERYITYVASVARDCII